jgi:hypothetical protein
MIDRKMAAFLRLYRCHHRLPINPATLVGYHPPSPKRDRDVGAGKWHGLTLSDRLLNTHSPPEKRPGEAGHLVSIDHLNNPVSRIKQDGSVVNNSIAILGDAILARHIVLGHAARGQISANSDFAIIAVRAVLLA